MSGGNPRVEFATIEGTAVQTFCAAQLTAALRGCAAGNGDDCRWLALCGVDFITTVAPGHTTESAARELIAVALGRHFPNEDQGQ